MNPLTSKNKLMTNEYINIFLIDQFAQLHKVPPSIHASTAPSPSLPPPVIPNASSASALHCCPNPHDPVSTLCASYSIFTPSLFHVFSVFSLNL